MAHSSSIPGKARDKEPGFISDAAPSGGAALRSPSSVQVHLRLPKADADALKSIAEGRGQTQSTFVRFMLKRYLEANRTK